MIVVNSRKVVMVTYSGASENVVNVNIDELQIMVIQRKWWVSSSG